MGREKKAKNIAEIRIYIPQYNTRDEGMDLRTRPTIDCEEGEEGAGLMRGEGVHLEHGRRVWTYAQHRMPGYEQISQEAGCIYHRCVP